MTFAAAWALLKRILPYLVAIAVFCAWTFAAYHYGVTHDQARSDAVIAGLKLQHTTTLGQINSENERALTAANVKAREAEQYARDAMTALDLKHTKEMNDEKTKAEKRIADVRAGVYRLRPQFTCTGSNGRAASGASQASVSTGVGDAAAAGGLRNEDAEFLVSESERADTIVRQLSAAQDALRACGAAK